MWGPIGPQNQDSLFALTEIKQTVCISLYLSYHMNENTKSATPQPDNLNPSNPCAPFLSYKQKI